MTKQNFRLVTIVCEPVLSTNLSELIRSLGASGFTVTEVRGEGSGEKSSGEVPDLKTKIEIITTVELSKKLMDKVAQDYFENYSIIVYASDIQVIRDGKF
jgi:nitrogen regulatory protein PII